MKKGLVLEGGGMRGLFTAGVIDVFLENGIAFDGMIGVSAGAAFGCNFKSRQKGRVLRYNVKYCRDPRYCSFRSLIKTGDIFGADFCYREMPKKLDVFDDDTYNKNPMKFYVVATDLASGAPVYRECPVSDDSCLEWIRASASMPLVSRTVNIDGFELLDGGAADSVPLRFFESSGYSKNVVVLTQPSGYEKGKNKALPLIKFRYRKYPAFIETMAHRHEVYNATLKYIDLREKDGDVFVIRPERKLEIGRVEHDPEVLRDVYECGRLTALEKLNEIKEFLK